VKDLDRITCGFLGKFGLVLKTCHRARLSAYLCGGDFLLAEPPTYRAFNRWPADKSNRSQFFDINLAVRATVQVKRHRAFLLEIEIGLTTNLIQSVR
jgi:hypothetical protein